MICIRQFPKDGVRRVLISYIFYLSYIRASPIMRNVEQYIYMYILITEVKANCFGSIVQHFRIKFSKTRHTSIKPQKLGTQPTDLGAQPRVQWVAVTLLVFIPVIETVIVLYYKGDSLIRKSKRGLIIQCFQILNAQWFFCGCF